MKKIEINPETASAAAREAVLEYPDWQLVRLLNVSENIIFEARNKDGEKAVLRIHRPNYQTSAAIASELQWMAFLSTKGIETPVPIKAVNGNLITSTSNNLQATMVSWIEGEQLQAIHEKVADTTDLIGKIYFLLGGLIAQIHNASDTFELPMGFERHRWDIAGFLGENPLWGRFWDNPALAPDDRKYLLDLKAVLTTHLQEFLADEGDFGLIHADVISENVLVEKGQPTIIDYDDAGFGFRMYDLAVPLYRFYPSPNFSGLADLLQKGYTVYRPLPGNSVDWLLSFILLRRLALLGWVVPRRPPDEIVSRTRSNLQVVKALVREINLGV